MENQQENQNETEPKQKETVKFNGISHQINLGQGTETHRLFAEFITANNFTAREGVFELLKGYGRNADEAKLQQLQSENAAYEATLKNNEMEIAELKQKLEAANTMANENAVSGLGLTAQVEEMKLKLERTIQVHPFVWPYLVAEAEAQKKSPGAILQGIYTDMLQDRRPNNLTKTVGKSAFRQALNKWKEEHKNQ